MEVNEYWGDRNALERVIQVVAELDAGQMEQPVDKESRKSSETRDRMNNRSPDNSDNRPPDQ
ncbi:hypothetical protein [Marinobacter sp.]|uniref:hypothetical protein n=1 Tax=Marinobacter sp. TaxID=50741 RepID=UPI0034A2F468